MLACISISLQQMSNTVSTNPRRWNDIWPIRECRFINLQATWQV